MAFEKPSYYCWLGKLNPPLLGSVLQYGFRSTTPDCSATKSVSPTLVVLSRQQLTKACVWLADGLVSIPVEHFLAQLTRDPLGVFNAVLAFPVPQGGVINTWNGMVVALALCKKVCHGSDIMEGFSVSGEEYLRNTNENRIILLGRVQGIRDI